MTSMYTKLYVRVCVRAWLFVKNGERKRVEQELQRQYEEPQSVQIYVTDDVKSKQQSLNFSHTNF